MENEETQFLAWQEYQASMVCHTQLLAMLTAQGIVRQVKMARGKTSVRNYYFILAANQSICNYDRLYTKNNLL